MWFFTSVLFQSMPKTATDNRLDPAESGAGRSAVTRERILEAAAQQFADRGFDGARFREIGDIAEVSFQSIRYHFGSKELLWEAVVERLSDAAEDAITRHEQALADLPPEQQLRAQVRAIVAYQAAHPLLQRILLCEAMKGSARYRKAFKRHVKSFERSATRFLGRLQKVGVIKADIELEDLFYVFRGAINYRLVAPPAGDVRGTSGSIREDVIERHAETITRLLLADR
jgi:AcrR family transcriptional regulator